MAVRVRSSFHGSVVLHDKHVNQFSIGGFVSSKPGATAHMLRKRIGNCHLLRLLFIKAIEQFFDELMKPGLVELFWKRFSDKSAGLLGIHVS